MHDGTSLTGPSTLTLSDGQQYAVIACTHIPASCSEAAAACKLEVAAGLAEERAEALRSSLEPSSGCHVAVGVASSTHGLQWVLAPAQPGWSQDLKLERAGAPRGSKGPSAKRQVRHGAWRLAAVLLTVAAAALLGFAVGSS